MVVEAASSYSEIIILVCMYEADGMRQEVENKSVRWKDTQIDGCKSHESGVIFCLAYRSADYGRNFIAVDYSNLVELI